MITKDGYSKDPTIRPEGIVVTWGKDLIEEKGGLLAFIRFFEKEMADPDCFWLQKCKNAPKGDVLYVYVIVAGRVAYRCFYGGHQTGPTNVFNGNGATWSKKSVVSWPRIILAGPIEKAPRKIYLRGFQGFRYCTKLF